LSSGTFIAPSSNLTVTGNFNSSGGTFTHNYGTVTLNGLNQTITGSNTFFILAKLASVLDTLTFAAGSTQTIAQGGSANLVGDYQKLLALSSSSPGTKWNLTINGSSSINYVSVTDSDASGGNIINATNSTNNGNNTNWDFGTAGTGGSSAHTSSSSSSSTVSPITTPNIPSQPQDNLSEITRLQTLIAQIKNQIQDILNNQPSNEPTNQTTNFQFTKNLKIGDKSPDVKNLQQFLNANNFTIALTGPGSMGNETTFFGELTKEALIKFQETYSEQILKPYGYTLGNGLFGPLTRKTINALLGSQLSTTNN